MSKLSPWAFKQSAGGHTQAAGAVTLEVNPANVYQIYVTTSDTATAGTAAVAVRYPESTNFVALKDSEGNAVSINLTAPEAILVENAVISAVRITPTSFDADKTFKLVVAARYAEV